MKIKTENLKKSWFYAVLWGVRQQRKGACHALVPESSASANSAIPAYSVLCPLIFTRRGPPRRSLLFGETYCSAESATIKSHFCGFIGMKGCIQSNNSIISCQGENVKQKIRFFRAEEQKFAFSVQEPLQSCRKAVLEMTLAKNIPPLLLRENLIPDDPATAANAESVSFKRLLCSAGLLIVPFCGKQRCGA